MDQQQSSSNRAGSTFVKCLGCEKLVRLPSDPDPNAIVRCPRCEETYPIGVLLDAEIPELEIVDAVPTKDEAVKPEIDIQTDEQNRFIVAPALSKGAKRPKRRGSSGSRANGQADAEWNSNREPRNREPSEATRSKRRPARKKPESGRGEMIKIVLGALMAPPVAQLVIWWGLHLDPLKFGPVVSKAIPAIVPAAFHDNADEDLEKDESGLDESGSSNEDDASSEKRPDLPSDEENKSTNVKGWPG